MSIRHAVRAAVTTTLAAGVLALGTGAAYASSFLSWEGPQNTGRAKVVHACGCNNIDPNFRAAYRFKYTGQTAAMYNAPDCKERPLSAAGLTRVFLPKCPFRPEAVRSRSSGVDVLSGGGRRYARLS